MNDSRRRKRVTLQDLHVPLPFERPALTSAAQPLAPHAFRCLPEAADRSRVSGDTEVRVVPSQLSDQQCVLVCQFDVPVIPAPQIHTLVRSTQAFWRRLFQDYPLPLS